MKIFNDYDLTACNSYRVKAVAARVFMPETDDDIVAVFSDRSRPRIILGGGCNVILSKDYYDQLDFVIFNAPFSACSVQGNTIIAEAGLSLKILSETAYENELAGLEYFYDVPGSVGGAVFMNAETLGESVSDGIDNVTFFDTTNLSFKTLPKQNLAFGYRQSIFQQRPEWIVVRARLVLPHGDSRAIHKKMMDNLTLRHQKQPWDVPSAGSVFRRPQGRFVGPMIEQLGLKGHSCGGAMVSPKHAGFIVNYNGKATGRDILDLIALIQDKVFAAYQVKLELEQRII
ncbi:MAG: UDP-N-acetylmuramate dehydrogenase [Anaerohalosphaeraceae bacterium]